MKWRCGDRIISAENPGRFCGWFFEILIWDGWNPLKPQPMGCLPLINGWLGFRWPIHSIRESIYQDPRVLTAIGPLVTDVRPWPHGLFHSFFWTSGSIFLGKSMEIRFASEKGLVCAKIGRNSALSNHEIIWNPRALSFVFYFLPCGNQTWQWKLLNL